MFGPLSHDFKAFRHHESATMMVFLLGFSLPLIFNKKTFCVCNRATDKTAEHNEARDTHSPPDNLIISKPCSVTNKCTLSIMESCNLGARGNMEDL